jgi:hypothetical protein
MRAAHALGERGFAVVVLEWRRRPGGKAGSIPVRGTGEEGRPVLPGEHGFRFFPRFYRHVIHTMSRIPYGPTRTVADNLVDTTRCQLNRYGRHPIDLIARSPRTITDVRVMLDDLGSGWWTQTIDSPWGPIPFAAQAPTRTDLITCAPPGSVPASTLNPPPPAPAP